MTITAGATDQTIYIEAVEDVGGTNPGEPKTGLLAANITGSQVRTREARVAITMATLVAASSTHVDGGFIEIDATNAPGLYRTDLPDAAVATGVPEVIAFYNVAGASNALIRPVRIQLSELDLQDGAGAGLTNLDAAISSVATDVWGQPTTISTATTTFGGLVDETVSSRSTLATTDLILASAIWNEPLALNATATTLYGGLIQLQLDAAVSSRSTLATTDLILASAIWAEPLAANATATTLYGGLIQSHLDIEVSSRATSNAADVWADVGDTATGPPPLAPTRAQEMDWIFTLNRNEINQTSTVKSVLGTATTITLATAAVSDDGTTFIRGVYG